MFKFRVIKLQNGLTALLIADIYPKTSCQDDDQDKSEQQKYFYHINLENKHLNR